MKNTDNVEKIDLDKIDWRSSREFFESLGEELDKLDDKDESYNFTWVGKRKSIIEAGAPINKTLRPDMEASRDFDNTKNMLIVGDNLDALKLLQESYLGKIKMIYIDPPYNTGSDFVYHDNFTIKKSDFIDSSTGPDGNMLISEDEYSENSKTNGRFHSDWLSMLYPRLKLARNLLSDDGVLFVSIDDNEQANLKKICDEIFGEENYIGILKWKKKKQPSFASRHIAPVIEYIYIYAKNEQILGKLSTEKISDETKKVINIYNPMSIRRFKPGVIVKSIQNGTIPKGECKIKTMSVEYLDDAIIENGKTTNEISVKAKFLNTQENINAFIDEGLLFITENNGLRRYVSEKEKENDKAITDLLLDWGDNQDSEKDINELFDSRVFDYSKPKTLLKKLARAAKTENSTVLDFFAGSGTTGHAVMDLNAEDGGNRKYILVQLDEPTDDKSEAKKAGYSTINQITAERLRRAGDKIIKEHPDLEGKLDTGFRVFHIDSENENTDIRKPLKDVSQTDLFNSIDNIKKDRTPLDLLFGVVYASALPFDLKLETKKIDSNTVYLYGYLDEDSGLVACFDDNISEDTIKEIAKLKPLTAAFKDSSFQDSAAKINLSEQFRVIAPDTKVKVI